MRNIVTYQGLGRMGRFANGCYQISGTIGVARRNGYDFAFPAWHNWDHKDRFGSTEDIDLGKYFVHPLPLYTGTLLPEYFVQWGFHDVKLNRSVSLSGHMQSTRFFEHCIDEVKWYFEMKDEYPETDAIALHCRLGDYDGGYHPRMDMNYYGPALEHFDSDHPVIVFSDDIEAARKMFHGKRFSFYDSDYIDSFKKMKSCKNFIIGNSSYSAFAAVLNGEKVVAPSPWFGKKYTNITGRDIYNKDWVVIDYEKNLVHA